MRQLSRASAPGQGRPRYPRPEPDLPWVHDTLRGLQRFFRFPKHSKPKTALLLQHVTPGCILQGRVCLATHGRRLDLLSGMRGEPGEPVRPPTPAVALGGRAPPLGRIALAVLVRPIGTFATRRVDDAGDVAARRKSEAHLAALPKGQQSKAKKALQEIWMAETNKDALAAFDAFIETWGVKYDKAVKCLVKDRDTLLAFYDFPAEH